MSASMAEVLRTHQWAETSDRCTCGKFLPFLDQAIAIHQAEVLAANGYGSIRAAAAVGWDAAVGQMVYEDGTPVQVATNDNPYRRPE